MMSIGPEIFMFRLITQVNSNSLLRPLGNCTGVPSFVPSGEFSKCEGYTRKQKHSKSK